MSASPHTPRFSSSSITRIVSANFPFDIYSSAKMLHKCNCALRYGCGSCCPSSVCRDPATSSSCPIISSGSSSSSSSCALALAGSFTGGKALFAARSCSLAVSTASPLASAMLCSRQSLRTLTACADSLFLVYSRAISTATAASCGRSFRMALYASEPFFN